MFTSNVLKINNEIRCKVHEQLGIDSKDVDDKVRILKEWMKKEPHLPDNPVEGLLSNRLLRSKFQVEAAKESLEKYYTIKSMVLDTFKPIKILLPSQVPHVVVPLPNLTKNLERIIIVKIKTNNPFTEESIMHFMKYLMCASELFFELDYTTGTRVIQDFDGFTLDHFKAYLGVAARYWPMYQDGYKTTVAGIEYINVPNFLDTLMQAGKRFLSPKTFERITIHKTLDSLYQNVPKEYIPSDYGGDERPIEEFLKLWEQDFKDNIHVFPNVLAQGSREELRIGENKINYQFGIKGTFRSLNVD